MSIHPCSDFIDFSFFFFQAEDGIRDVAVTGVQTCALPISIERRVAHHSGLYEVIKYGVMGDAALYRYLERRLDDLLQRNSAALGWILPRCIRAKADVVGRDERESGLREILNFGHTFAHALEAATGYNRFLHGEAVGWGMIAATLLAVAREMLPENEAARIIGLVSRVGPRPPLPRIPARRMLEIMRADKKTRGGHLRFRSEERRVGKECRSRWSP